MKFLYIFMLAMDLVCHRYLHTIIGVSERTNYTLKSSGTDNLAKIFGVKLYLMKL